MNLVDRRSRDQVATEVRRWINQEITNAELHDVFNRVETDDSTITEVILDVGLYCPEDSTEKAVLHEDSWDHLQRLLLVLASGHHIERELVREPHIPSRVISGILLAGLMGCYLKFGFSWQLLVMWIGSGIVGVTLLLRGLKSKIRDESEGDFQPFASEEEMLALQRQVTEFKKTAPPSHLEPFTSQTKWNFGLVRISLFWIAIAPLTLLFLMTPIFFRYRDSRVVPSSS